MRKIGIVESVMWLRDLILCYLIPWICFTCRCKSFSEVRKIACHLLRYVARYKAKYIFNQFEKLNNLLYYSHSFSTNLVLICRELSIGNHQPKLLKKWRSLFLHRPLAVMVQMMAFQNLGLHWWIRYILWHHGCIAEM